MNLDTLADIKLIQLVDRSRIVEGLLLFLSICGIYLEILQKELLNQLVQGLSKRVNNKGKRVKNRIKYFIRFLQKEKLPNEEEEKKTSSKSKQNKFK